MYHISLVIRCSFFLPNNPQNLDPSYKIDLDLVDFSGLAIFSNRGYL